MRVRYLRLLIVTLGVAWVLGTFAGAVHMSDPQWALFAFRRMTPSWGMLPLGLYLGLSLILAPLALFALLKAWAAVVRNELILGLCGGLVFSFYTAFLQLALPFVGDHVNVPGLPLALALFGDHRLATILGCAFGINAVTYGGLGALTGLLVIRLGRPRHGRMATAECGTRERVAGLVLRGVGTACCLALAIGACVFWPLGPGRGAFDAFLAPFGLVPGIRYEADLTYARPRDVDLKLDLCMPAKPDGRLPAVVCIHGGGWHGGVRSAYVPLIVALARRGYVGVTVSYRLAPTHRFPAQIQDVRCAVQWLRANAEQYRIDPERIGTVGWSAGGHLACLLGTNPDAGVFDGIDGLPGSSSRIQAVVSFSGLTDLTAEYWDVVPSGARTLIGATIHETPDAYWQASPLMHVDQDDPPFLLLHGANDRVVPVDQSQRMHHRLRAEGVVTSLRIFPGVGHRWHGLAACEARQTALLFLHRHLKAGGGRAKEHEHCSLPGLAQASG